MGDARDLKSLGPKGLYEFDSRSGHKSFLINMAKAEFCIQNKHDRLVLMTGTYEDCMNYFNAQDKVFRRTHKIVNKKDVKFK